MHKPMILGLKFWNGNISGVNTSVAISIMIFMKIPMRMKSENR